MKKLALLLMLVVNSASAEYMKVTSKSQMDCLIQSRPNVLLVFERKTCPWCRKQMPVLKQFANSTDLLVLDVDIERFPGIAREWIPNEGVPSFVLTFNEEDSIDTVTESGYKDLNDLNYFVFGDE